MTKIPFPPCPIKPHVYYWMSRHCGFNFCPHQSICAICGAVVIGLFRMLLGFCFELKIVHLRTSIHTYDGVTFWLAAVGFVLAEQSILVQSILVPITSHWISLVTHEWPLVEMGRLYTAASHCISLVTHEICHGKRGRNMCYETRAYKYAMGKCQHISHLKRTWTFLRGKMTNSNRKDPKHISWENDLSI